MTGDQILERIAATDTLEKLLCFWLSFAGLAVGVEGEGEDEGEREKDFAVWPGV